MSAIAPRKAFEPDELLREMNALIEYADNSCSESEDFMRGMQFMFDMLVDKLEPYRAHDGADAGPALPAGAVGSAAPKLTP